MTDYPYMISNNKISPIIQKIQQAARPQKFTLEFLRNIGFTSTNDRAFIPLIKKLGFLMEDGVPTQAYDQLKDKTTSAKILAIQIQQLYSELYNINTEIHNASDDEIKGAIGRVTGKDQEGVNRIFSTFKALCSLANFNFENHPQKTIIADNEIEKEVVKSQKSTERKNEFHYNIQIHLPATNDISVYNAIFKSLKENLLI